MPAAVGGEILIVQYPGPSTGERPLYAGRFNMDKRQSQLTLPARQDPPNRRCGVSVC
jgi:hypothetical protein